MTRHELIACTGWTLGVGAVLVPSALVAGSGHVNVGGIAGAFVASFVLMPAYISWRIIEPIAGTVPGAIAAIAAEFACIFIIVYSFRRLRRRNANERKAG